MGGAGAFSAGGAGSLFGAAPGGDSNDPYANIAIDLTKVKSSEPPAKLHELKTAEEKKKEVRAAKSNLKNESENNKEKGTVSWGKSTTYEVLREDEEDDGEYHNKDVTGRGSPRPLEKKVLEEKDISDGRTEKEKIKEMLEKQERLQMEEINEN
jgi:hypothetical protein